MRSEAIDILRLYSEHSAKEWNGFLAICDVTNDTAKLVDVLRRVEMGMDNLVKQKLNSDKIVEFFLRIQRSLENTLRDIHRRQYPSHNLADKRMKRNDLERFMHKSRY